MDRDRADAHFHDYSALLHLWSRDQTYRHFQSPPLTLHPHQSLLTLPVTALLSFFADIRHFLDLLKKHWPELGLETSMYFELLPKEYAPLHCDGLKE